VFNNLISPISFFVENAMTNKTTRVRVNRKLAEEGMSVLGVKSRAEAVRFAVRWIFGLSRPQMRALGEALDQRISQWEMKTKG
jgi:hypothetical protein